MRIALAQKSPVTIYRSWNTPDGIVNDWMTLPSGGRVSPIVAGWDDGTYTVAEIIPFEIPEGKQTVGEPSYQLFYGVLLETYETEDAAPAEPSRQLVRKSIVQARLIDRGLMQAAYVALTSNAVYFARWFAPDRPEVYCDDPDAVLLLSAIGCSESDIAEIMAPEDGSA